MSRQNKKTASHAEIGEDLLNDNWLTYFKIHKPVII